MRATLSLVSRTQAAAFVTLLLAAVPTAQAQTWHAQAPGAAIITIGHNVGQQCSVTLYDPDSFSFPDDDMGFLAQGNNPNAFCSGIGTVPIDSFYTARFDRSTATWSSPSRTACPTLVGRYMTGGHSHNCGYSSTNPGPVASPDIVKIGSRYYMAFSGGNADYIKGHVFLAFSDDATNWTTFKWSPRPVGYDWRPVIYPFYGGPGNDHCYPFGVAQVSLAYDASDTSTGPNGTLYLYVRYVHGTPQRQQETVGFRAPFNPGFSWGFEIGGLQICRTSSATSPCAWVSHSGKLVWDYDGQPPAVAGDPILAMQQSVRQMPPGPMDVAWDPQRGNWLRVFTHAGTGQVLWQTATSLGTGLWTSSVAVDLQPMHSAMAARYPAYVPEEYYPGLWYGSGGSRTGMWIRMPVDYAGCAGFFTGLGVATSAFNFN